MNYKNWKIWFKQLPLSLKWFVVLILLRPLVDLFYFLKEISPFFSPLYIVGVATPVLILLSFLSRGFPKKFKSFISDFSFTTWSVIVLINLIVLFVFYGGLAISSEVIRYGSPLLLFFYIRHFVRSKVDLIGLLQSFVYSAIFPMCLLAYELMFGAINAEFLTESRGGGARLQGGYADIMNYAIYFTMAFLIQCYFFIRSSKLNYVSIKQRLLLIVVTLVCFIGLVGIKQSSSWAVMLFIGFLFLVYNLNSRKGIVVILITLPVLIFTLPVVYKSSIEPLIEKEYKVIEGEADLERSFNGRMSRWVKFFGIWSEMPIGSNLVGVTTSGHDQTLIMVSGGMHSDYVRVIFLSGILGFIFYMLFLLNLLMRARKIAIPERFLVFGGVGTVMLYSVSTNPLLYFPLLYCVFPIMAYASLPKLLLLRK